MSLAQNLKLATHLAKKHFYNFKKDYKSCKEKGEYARAIHAVDYLHEDVKDIVVEVNRGALEVSRATFDKVATMKALTDVKNELKLDDDSDVSKYIETLKNRTH